jgi:hypothetical protein
MATRRDAHDQETRPHWFSRIFWWLFAAGFWGWVVYEFINGSTQDRRWIAAAAALGFGVQYIANKIERLERHSASDVVRRLDQIERTLKSLREEIDLDRAPPPRATEKTSPPRAATK